MKTQQKFDFKVVSSFFSIFLLIVGIFFFTHPAYACACGIPEVAFSGSTPTDGSTLSTTTLSVALTTSAIGSSYSFLNLDHSLVGWFKFEANGDDSSGVVTSSTWNTDGSYDSGMFGAAGNFNGTTSLDVVLHDAINTSFTVSAWVYLNTLTEAAALVSDDNGHLLQIGGSSRWQFDSVYSEGAIATTSVWTHVVGVYDAQSSTETLYVDGVPIISGSSTRSITQDLYIGKRNDDIFINGKIDDVMLFKRALSANEVASLYDANANQYAETFANEYIGPHTYTGYNINSEGLVAQTATRTVTLLDPTNLLINPGAETGDFTGWTINGTLDNCGDYSDFRTGWCISGGHTSGNYGFISSYPFTDPWATMSQEVDLVGHGISVRSLDVAPDIIATTHVIGINENGGSPDDMYRVIVTLLDADHQVVDTWNTGDQVIHAIDGWTTVTHTFSGYGSGVRYITFEQDGKNTGTWGGAYGSIFDDASLVVDYVDIPEPVVETPAPVHHDGPTAVSTSLETLPKTVVTNSAPVPCKIGDIFNTSTGKPCVVISTTTSVIGLFTRDLNLGMSGKDVLALQNIIIMKNSGKIAQKLKQNTATGFFGPLTKSALIELQKANNILPATGNFGPRTRALVVI